MIKLTLPYLNDPITFHENVVYSLIIENSVCFRDVISDLYEQSIGCDGICVLSSDDKPIPISKNVELLSNFVPFELSKKSIISKIQSSLEKTAMDEDHYLKTLSLLSEIEKYISDLSYDFSVDISSEKLSIGSLIKAVGLTVREDDQTLIEKIFNYFELIREFEKDKLFICVNMRNYFSDNEMKVFFDSIISHKYTLLMIESHERALLPYEKRTIIDEDLCEI